MAQAYRTLVRDEASGQLKVVLREVGSDTVVVDPSGYSIVKLDEGRNPIPVNYWLDRPVDFSSSLPSPDSIDGLNPPSTPLPITRTQNEDRSSVGEDLFPRNEGRSSDTQTPVSENAYNKDGTPNRMGEAIIDRGRGFLGAAAGAAIGTAVAGPIGGLVGGLAARGLNSKLGSRLGDKISPAGQLYGWGIGQPKPEAVIAEIDRDRARQAPAVSTVPSTPQAQNRASGAVPSYNDLINTPVSTNAGLGRVSQASYSTPSSVGRSAPNTDLEAMTGKANISYELDNKNRPHRPDLETVDRVRSAVGTALPGYSVNVTSGLGEFGSDRHRAANGGRAFDYNLTDPSGRKVTPETDRAAYNKVAESMASHGIKGIGHYGWGIHADTVRTNSWGPTQGLASLNPSFGSAIERGRANPNTSYTYSGPPTPTSRPDPLSQQTTQAVAQSARTGRADFNTMSIGDIAFSGYGQRPDPSQISAMSHVMAGELGPKTLEGLRVGDPTARLEAANVVSTMENRRQSVGFSNVTNPSQYNSLMGENRRVTDANYSKYGGVLESTIQDTYAGRNPPSNTNATHYANMSISNPSWGASLTDKQRVGDHTFGTIPGEYQTSKDRLSQARQAAEVNRRAYEDSRATPAQDVSPRTNSLGLSAGGFASLGFSGGPAGKTRNDTEKSVQDSSKDTTSAADRNSRDSKSTTDSSSRNSSSSDRGGNSGLGSRDSTPSGRSSSSSSSGRSSESSSSGGGLGSRSSSGGVTPGAERQGSSLNSSSSSNKNDKDKDKDSKSSTASDGSSRGGGRRT